MSCKQFSCLVAYRARPTVQPTMHLHGVLYVDQMTNWFFACPPRLSQQQTNNICSMAVLRHFAKQSYCECITSPLYREPKALRLMRQYRNRFYSNADHTRRIRKGCNVTKSDACAKKSTGRIPCAYSFVLYLLTFIGDLRYKMLLI